MGVEGTASAFSERVAGGRYIEIRPDRLAAARVGLNVSDINYLVAAAIGGINVSRSVVRGEIGYRFECRFGCRIGYRRGYATGTVGLRGG